MFTSLTLIRYASACQSTTINIVLAKFIIIAVLLAIVYSLASSFYFLVHDKGEGDRTVRRLTWRVGLSLGLVLLLFAGFKLGFIEPRGANPIVYPTQPAGQ